MKQNSETPPPHHRGGGVVMKITNKNKYEKQERKNIKPLKEHLKEEKN